jgi:hypothetical protein
VCDIQWTQFYGKVTADVTFPITLPAFIEAMLCGHHQSTAYVYKCAFTVLDNTVSATGMTVHDALAFDSDKNHYGYALIVGHS